MGPGPPRAGRVTSGRQAAGPRDVLATRSRKDERSEGRGHELCSFSPSSRSAFSRTCCLSYDGFVELYPARDTTCRSLAGSVFAGLGGRHGSVSTPSPPPGENPESLPPPAADPQVACPPPAPAEAPAPGTAPRGPTPPSPGLGETVALSHVRAHGGCSGREAVPWTPPASRPRPPTSCPGSSGHTPPRPAGLGQTLPQGVNAFPLLSLQRVWGVSSPPPLRGSQGKERKERRWKSRRINHDAPGGT